MPKSFEEIRRELGDDYEDTRDEYEIRLRYAEYEQASAKLLDKIGQRDELVGLLKYAAPARVADVREGIARFDKFIDEGEKYVAMRYDVYLKAIEVWRAYMKLEKMTRIIEPELRKRIAENDSEKLELLEAMLSGDYKTH